MALTILDCINYWSPTGGGVRRYFLEKMKYFSQCHDVKNVAVLTASSDRTEVRDDGSVIEYLAAPKLPYGDYRLLLRTRSLRRVLAKYQPDVIELAFPWLLPSRGCQVFRETNDNAALVGFWHADFPRTYVGRLLKSVNRRLEEPSENCAWWWARRQFSDMDGVLVASRWVSENVANHGIEQVKYLPLGVNSDTFHPRHRDPALVEKLKAGQAERLVIFFPHRLSQEKGVRTLLEAYPRLCAKLDVAPALVFAGDGPFKRSVIQASQRHQHVHYLGYIEDTHELARWYASSDASVALSAYETFGLSVAEAMASGLAMIGADIGGAAELIEDSGCGLTIPRDNVDALVYSLLALATSSRRDDLGKLGREYIERFTWKSTFDQQLSYLRELVRQRRIGDEPAGELQSRAA